MPPGVRLGTWTCPSGSSVEAFYVTTGATTAKIEMAWDVAPPLAPADDVYYLGVIQPAVARLVAEHTKRTGRTLVVVT